MFKIKKLDDNDQNSKSDTSVPKNLEDRAFQHDSKVAIFLTFNSKAAVVNSQPIVRTTGNGDLNKRQFGFIS